MNSWKHRIPEGVQDYLPGECYNKRKIEDCIRNIFFYSGYEEIETPAFEYLDVFNGDIINIEQEKMYKIVEAGSRILVMRPDLTMPIARIAATKLKKSTLPLRLSYISSVYRYEELEIDKQREIPQAGIELLGVAHPEADAEVISIAIQIFMKLGLSGFQIDIGQVDFFKGLIEESNIEAGAAEELRVMIDQKNILGLKTYLQTINISDKLKDILLKLPQLYGGVEVLEEAMKLTQNPRCIEAVRNIYQVYEVIKAYGLEKYISFDLGMVQSLNYYTGVIFRGISKNMGFPLCGGGRYDNLLPEFGYDIPATGFAIGIKRLLVSLEMQKKLKDIPNIDVLAVVNDNHKDAFKLVQELREQGKRVEIFIPTSDSSNPLTYAKQKGINKIIKIGSTGVQEL